MRTDLNSVQHQLADHYQFAAGLDERIDGINGNLATVEENLDLLAVRQAPFTAETAKVCGTLEQSINCVGYGLMEYGGFVRNGSLSSEQVRHMMTQERGNFVVWNDRNGTENTDPMESEDKQMEQAEEESPTSDAEMDPNYRSSGVEIVAKHAE